MSAVLTVARKELRALFQSPVALLFLGVFELVTLFAFFQGSRFFARGIADVRPLFEWLPLLLVFLTAAVTMRAWAEERKMGTLEVLLTLPVRTRDLVLGKFVAATALVAVALLLTVPLPLMVSTLGPLDWGPVIGGYLGALLLGATYVGLGLCVSARTDNQVVSLMLTLVAGGLLYVVGSDVVTGLFGTAWAETLRSLGTGARFASIERGVVDLRDLAYYAALTTTFLALNGVFLEVDRVDRGSERGAARSRALWITTLLVAANAVLAVVWLTPVTAARVDLTEHGDFSVSEVTERQLAQLTEPLYLEGYFSERTHPLLAPLVPQIRDLLTEYGIEGEGQVKVRFADPNEDEDLEVELAERYSIRSVPFQVDERNQTAVVNSFFHILVRYGDQYEVLSFDDLIEFTADANGADVRLRNLEYDLTATIKRLSQDFQSVSSVLASLPEPATLTAYITPSTLPADYAELPDLIREVGTELALEGGDQLAFEEVDPSGDEALQERLYAEYGLRPLAVDLLATQTFYLDLVLTMGDEVERLTLRGDVTKSDLRQGLEAAIQRITPGQLTTIGLLTEQPTAPPPNPNLPPQFQPPPPQPDYRLLSQVLADGYEVQPVTGDDGTLPATLDLLLVARPGALTEEQRFAIDQFLMRGGKVITLASAYDVEVGAQGLSASAADTSWLDQLASYGVTVESSFVVDEQNAPFPRPVQERRGSLTLQRIELTPYPFFVDVRSGGLSDDHAATAGLTNLTLPWGSPLSVEPPEGVTADTVVSTSNTAWTYEGTRLDPPAPSDERASYPVAVTLSGTFPSFFADRDSPLFDGEGEGDRTGRTIKASLPDARLAVVGSADLVSDLILQLAGQPGGEVHRGNYQLLQNLVDWSVEDTDLLAIRSSGAFARTLVPLSESERSTLELVQYGLAVVLLLLVAMAARTQRRATHTLPLDRPVEAS